MASYGIYIKSSVEMDLRPRLAPWLRRIWARIDGLSTNPLPRQSIKLTGGESLFPVHAGDHKAIYRKDRDRKSRVLHPVRHRAHAYRQRKGRLALSWRVLFPFEL